MPILREGNRFLVDPVEADGVEMVRKMVREGRGAAEVWRVSELRGLDGSRADGDNCSKALVAHWRG